MITDRILDHLRGVIDQPDLSATRYRLIREIGRGGMGTVYLAHDPVLDREVAIKILDDPREARTVAGLEHPGIVPVHDAGALPDGRVYYAMKMVRGERLDQWLLTHTGLAERLRIFLRISEPIAFAHARGVAHRDLKPGNIMVGECGEILVLDWGSPGAATPQFMAPEQASRTEGGAQVDVFAMGRILSILLQIEAPIPKPLRSICRKATEVNPGRRYSDANAFAADITAWADRMPVQAHRESLWERAGRLFARHGSLAAIVVAYLVMRVILFFWASR